MLRQQPISVGAPLAQVGLRQQRRAPNLKGCWRNARQYTHLRWRTVGATRQRYADATLARRSRREGAGSMTADISAFQGPRPTHGISHGGVA
jgi:hypothetical protein